VAGSLGPDGYIPIGVDGRDYRAHRLAWLYVHGVMPTDEEEVDHRDRNRRNNAIGNLRMANLAQQKNNLGLRRNNTSGVKGVSFVKETGRWRAYIQADGKWRFLGGHATLEAAANARKAAAEELHGQFGNHARRAEPARATA
jgi:hypothetical protein